MNKNAWIITIVIVVITILVGVWYYLYQDRGETIFTPTANTDQEEQTQDTPQESKVESITLEAVTPYKGTGMATRIFAKETFTHTVIATIDDPAAGRFYEGWLVKNPATKEFFSTGKLVKEDGAYKLTYTASKNYPDYKGVVITEETSANGLDGVPEAHVLEGSFSE